jgi:ssRNA-specific RNase YbeY (16S rRNA maturation enzyme)
MQALIPYTSVPDIQAGPFAVSVLSGHQNIARYQTIIDNCLQAYVALWPVFLQQVKDHNLLAITGLSTDKTWEGDVAFVDNATIHAFNAQYRHKPQATDVLTFTLFADANDPTLMAQLPVAHLGSIVISLDWASDELGITPEMLQNATETPLRGNFTQSETLIMLYLLERMLHGTLHLLGVTHDTEQDYTRVVEIQRHVLESILR